jgi:hypothetical protein
MGSDPQNPLYRRATYDGPFGHTCHVPLGPFDLHLPSMLHTMLESVPMLTAIVANTRPTRQE